MTSREQLLAVLSEKIPDHVPVAPDTSNMIPDCVIYFGFDSLMDGYVQISVDELGEIEHD